MFAGFAIMFADLAIMFADFAIMFADLAISFADLAIMVADLAILFADFAIMFADLAIMFADSRPESTFWIFGKASLSIILSRLGKSSRPKGILNSAFANIVENDEEKLIVQTKWSHTVQFTNRA
ncbi:hypothetical protein M8J77_007066 [Diaphorina citri]|nr:hypothetical protein M8J77_007066 [Diaphorina citri]